MSFLNNQPVLITAGYFLGYKGIIEFYEPLGDLYRVRVEGLSFGKTEHEIAAVHDAAVPDEMANRFVDIVEEFLRQYAALGERDTSN